MVSLDISRVFCSLDMKKNLNLDRMSTQQRKVYNLAVNKVIPAIAAGFLIAGTLSVFFISPWFGLSLVPLFVIMTCSHNCAIGNQESIQFIDNQPIGIQNPGNQCWSNSVVQLLMNNQSIRQRSERLAPLRAVFDSYRTDEQARNPVSQRLDGTELMRILADLTNGDQISYDFRQEDPSTAFELLLGSTTGNPYQFLQQQVDGRRTVQIREPFTSLDLVDGMNFYQSFDSAFDSLDEYNQRITIKFINAPDTLMIKSKRFKYEQSHEGLIPVKINRPLDIPLELVLNNAKTLDGAARTYECSGFIVHRGDSVESGHYISYVKKSGVWWCCNDDYIRRVNLSEVLQAKKHSYIATYAKK